jgi:hypothetical protein
MSEESSDKSLKCLWGDCGEVLTTADELYAHTCEHVGRKSDNNLKLTCAWSECRLSFSKVSSFFATHGRSLRANARMSLDYV